MISYQMFGSMVAAAAGVGAATAVRVPATASATTAAASRPGPEWRRRTRALRTGSYALVAGASRRWLPHKVYPDGTDEHRRMSMVHRWTASAGRPRAALDVWFRVARHGRLSTFARFAAARWARARCPRSHRPRRL